MLVGLPLNMDGSHGPRPPMRRGPRRRRSRRCSTSRCVLVDERLTTVTADRALMAGGAAGPGPPSGHRPGRGDRAPAGVAGRGRRRGVAVGPGPGARRRLTTPSGGCGGSVVPRDIGALRGHRGRHPRLGQRTRRRGGPRRRGAGGPITAHTRRGPGPARPERVTGTDQPGRGEPCPGRPRPAAAAPPHRGVVADEEEWDDGDWDDWSDDHGSWGHRRVTGGAACSSSPACCCSRLIAAAVRDGRLGQRPPDGLGDDRRQGRRSRPAPATPTLASVPDQGRRGQRQLAVQALPRLPGHRPGDGRPVHVPPRRGLPRRPATTSASARRSSRSA